MTVDGITVAAAEATECSRSGRSSFGGNDQVDDHTMSIRCKAECRPAADQGRGIVRAF